MVAPSSPQRDDQRLRDGVAYLRRRGYDVVEGSNLWKRYGYLAGSDQERADDLNAALADSAVRMVIGSRGGFGMTRILDRIRYDSAAADPKIVVGFSDLTALNCALLSRARLVSFSGALPGVDFWKDMIDQFAEESFWRILTDPEPIGPVVQPPDQPLTCIQPGTAEGYLVPANLTLLASIVGTPWFPPLDGAILVIEEIGEEAYRVDRLLAQLWNAGALSNLAGLVFGAFTGAAPKRISVDPLPIEEVFAEYARRVARPTVQGLLYGHIATKLTLPLGVRARLDANAGSLEIIDSAVAR